MSQTYTDRQITEAAVMIRNSNQLMDTLESIEEQIPGLAVHTLGMIDDSDLPSSADADTIACARAWAHLHITADAVRADAEARGLRLPGRQVTAELIAAQEAYETARRACHTDLDHSVGGDDAAD
jgi:hypothetical protein